MDSQQSDDEFDYDMVTGANATPPTLPKFLTGPPMPHRNKTPQQQCINDDTLDTTLPAQQIPVHTNTPNINSEAPVNHINRLADVIMDMNSNPSAQTMMVRPVSTTTLTIDGKSEKFELFEDLF